MAIHVTRRCSSCTAAVRPVTRGVRRRGGGRRNWCTYTRFAGHGESDWSAEANYSLQDFALDLISIADAVGSNPVIVGASLGGLTNLLAMGRERPGLGGLVLVDIVPEMEQAGTDRIGAFMMRHVEYRVCLVARGRRHRRRVQPPSRSNDRSRQPPQEPPRARWPLVLALGPRFMSSIKRSNGARRSSPTRS